MIEKQPHDVIFERKRPQKLRHTRVNDIESDQRQDLTFLRTQLDCLRLLNEDPDVS